MNKRIFIFINKNNLRIKSYYIFKLRMINEIKDKQINTLKKKLKLIIIYYNNKKKKNILI